MRILIEGMRDSGVFMVDAAGLVASWNSGARHLLGYEDAEILGKPCELLYLPEDRARGLADRELATAAELGRCATQGWRQRKDGSRFWSDVLINPIHENGALVGYAQVVRDATDQRMAADALRASEERFRLLVEGVVDYAIFWLDPSGCITSWNAGAERITGYAAAEVSGSHFSRFFTDEDRVRHAPERTLSIAAAEGRYVGQGWRVRKDGTRFWAYAVVDRILDAEGRLIGFAKITHDETDQRANEEALHEAHALLERRVMERTQELTQRTLELERLNEALRQARREAEDASRVKSQFLAAASHDLRQPFQAMRLFYDLARRQNADPKLDPTLQGLGTALSAGEDLLRALLEVSSLDSGVVQPAIEDVDLAVLVDQLATEMRVLTESKGLRMVVRSRPVTVRSDPTLLKRALRNLVQNAIRYTEQGGVLIASRATPSGAAVTVCDSGVGIAAENIEHIFRDFYQLHNPERDRAKGLGLGLPVVRRMTAMLGHRIEVRSRPGCGSVFTLRFDMPPPAVTR